MLTRADYAQPHCSVTGQYLTYAPAVSRFIEQTRLLF